MEKTSDIIIEIIEKYGFEVYSIKHHQVHGVVHLDVTINKDTVEIKKLEEITLSIASAIDLEKYEVELSARGIERSLDNTNEITSAIGKYIYLESNFYNGYAHIIDFNGKILLIKINVKGQFKQLSINLEDVSFIRLAVKI